MKGKESQRLAYSKTEAAEVLGVSVDFFDAHIQHEVACVRRGRRRLYPKQEIVQWLERSAEKTMAVLPAGVVVAAAVLGALS